MNGTIVLIEITTMSRTSEMVESAVHNWTSEDFCPMITKRTRSTTMITFSHELEIYKQPNVYKLKRQPQSEKRLKGKPIAPDMAKIMKEINIQISKIFSTIPMGNTTTGIFFIAIAFNTNNKKDSNLLDLTWRFRQIEQKKILGAWSSENCHTLSVKNRNLFSHQYNFSYHYTILEISNGVKGLNRERKLVDCTQFVTGVQKILYQIDLLLTPDIFILSP
ncbi:hypothetical protein BpHYR1_027129 [Brachionus plicatilis]|uniref:Uncharacterized protein n=1 Tax=Brachionus plicatilis TaxID=10195 RepID=A0A3M7QEB5_BRAPC|nr:hypothetical protein BpHYR1_027129 [Brachionus plicatilis]